MFKGRFDKELYKEYGKWLFYITDIFLVISDSENGDLRQLPFSDSVLDQPYMTMQIIKIIQLNYRKHLSEEMKKVKIQNKARGITKR